LQALVKRISNVDTLDAILDRIFTADSLKDASKVVDELSRSQA